jgi:hypothetical protein
MFAVRGGARRLALLMLDRTGAPTRDGYADLLQESRRLSPERRAAREQWLATLPEDHVEEALFELEMLLKGLVCFGNLRNQPGPPARSLPPDHDHHEELRVLRDALERCVALCRVLQGERGGAGVRGAPAEETAQSRLVKEPLAQDTPHDALRVLRSALAAFVELADALLRAGRVPERAFLALHATITREIGRNAYFDPLVTLEFRPEFDALRSLEARDALAAAKGEATQRVAALCLLSLGRAQRYLALVEACTADDASARRAYVLLAVLRSDLRALTRFLSRRAAEQLADGAEQTLLTLDTAELVASAGALATALRRLALLRGVLDTVASTLRVEMRKAFERDIPVVAPALTDAVLAAQLRVVAVQVRAALHHATHALCAALRQETAEPVLDAGTRRAASERLRREVWMFLQVLRAFDAKASAPLDAVARWSAPGSFSFVRDFLQHFRILGRPLAQRWAYPRMDACVAALASLRDADLLDAQRMADAAAECRALHAYLEQRFAELSERPELAGAPFDRRDAAETLRIYLAAG